MTGTEIMLIMIGIVLMLGSFMVTEKLSNSELNKIAELSQNEIKSILSKELKNASEKIENQIDISIEDSIDKVERSLDKETNEKIMAISEYSDTVFENMNKTHNEIMFLYSMLNDKHIELTALSGELSKVASEVQKEIEKVNVDGKNVHEKKEDTLEQNVPVKINTEEIVYNHNEKILKLHRDGMQHIDIAKELGLGLGEVKLVVDLYRGEEQSET